MTTTADHLAVAAPHGDDDPAMSAAHEREWLEYFDALAGASRAALNIPVGTGEDPAPAHPVVSTPTLPMPATLEAKRLETVQLLDRTTHEIERRQAEVVRELACLRNRPLRSAYHTDLGDALDLVG